MKRLLAVSALLAALALPSRPAQAQTGTARGRVVDAAGQPIVEAKVEILFQGGLNRKLETKTNKRGEYTQVGLNPGMYRFTGSKDGYQPYYLEFRVNLGDVTPIPDIKLQAKGAGGAAAAGGKELGGKVDNAIELTKAGKLDEAEAAYKELITTNPAIPELHYNLAYVYTQKKDWAGAEAEYKKVLEAKPDHTDALVRLARVYQDGGQIDKAMAFITQAAADHPSDEKVQFTVGLYYLNASKPDEAGVAFKKAEALDPSDAEVQYYIGTVAIQQNNVAEAVARLEKYLSMSPKNAQNVETAKGLVQALKPKK